MMMIRFFYFVSFTIFTFYNNQSIEPMKTNFFAAIILGITIVSCQKDKEEAMHTEIQNPLVDQWSTGYELPPFDSISNDHFKPAFELGISKHNKELDSIVAQTDEPTFKNTIEALEHSGSLLNRTRSVFNNLLSANTNKQLQNLAQELAPEFSKHSDDIYLNEKLFVRVQTVYDFYEHNEKEKLKLNREQQMLLEKTYKNFIRRGAQLEEEQKKKLRNINKELSVLTLKFGDNLLNENNTFELVIDDEQYLSGLPKDVIETARLEAINKNKEGKWVFTLHNASVIPFLQYADHRGMRQKIWNAYQMRGNNNNGNDNKENALHIADLRLQKANLLGYKNHASYILEETMAKTPEAVNELLLQLWKPALEKAKKEAADIQEFMYKDGIKEDVSPADWHYYTEKIRKQRYAFNKEELKPYFSLDSVRNGIFTVTEKLYGLKYEELKDAPKYHKDVTVWKVSEKNGKHVGILYMDMHPRESKRGGAWMTSFQPQYKKDGKRVEPVISIVCNFTKPTENVPALLTFDEVSTFFHEFGHALHGLLSNVQYMSLSGTNVPRDFVELPSQIMENWAAEPEVLKMFAKHYETGEVIPDAFIEKMKNAATFNQGFGTTEYLAASFLDLKYHSIESPIKGDMNTFELNAMKEIGLIDAIIPRYRSTYFSHIFAGGYDAGYYSYIWSEVLDSDAFEVFKKSSLFNKEKAKSFRTNILEKGGTEEPDILYQRFRGAAPNITPLLEKRGLLTE